MPQLNTAHAEKSQISSVVIISTVSLLVAIIAFKFFTPSSTQQLPVSQPSISIEIPKLTDAQTTEANRTQINVVAKTSKPTKSLALSSHTIKEHTVKAGESLSKIFQTHKFSPSTLFNIMQSGKAVSTLKNIQPGQHILFTKNDNGDFSTLEYQIDRIKTLRVAKTDTGYKTTLLEKPVEIATDTASVRIDNSLYYDGKQAGISDKTIMELANIFGWDIDFALNIRQGDSFTLLYETKFIDGERIENGHILAAEFINRGEQYQAVRFVNSKGFAEYFSPNGKSMRKTFLRTPIDFARVSSRFNLRRKHPVLNRIRAHKGVDYAAVTGTAIKATSDGKVAFRGRKGGYGRVIVLKHGQKYSTLYAHMSKYGRYKTGSTVKQGQTIGYVGKSGLATGPHLHYEFRVNGVHRNPLTVKFPAAKPVHKSQLAAFKQQTSPLLSQLELAKQTQLALN